MNFPPPTESQARILWFTLTAMAFAAILALIILLIWGLGWVVRELSPVLLPVALALTLAYILDPVVEYLVHKKLKRPLAIVVVFATGLVLVAAVVGSIIPGVFRESRTLISEMPKNPEELQGKIHDFFEHNPIGKRLPAVWQFFPAPPSHNSTNASAPVPIIVAPSPTNTNAVAIKYPATASEEDLDNSDFSPGTAGSSIMDYASGDRFTETVMLRAADVLKAVLKWVTNQLRKVATWAEFLIGFVLVPVYLFYFLLEKRGIRRRWTDYLPIHESKAKEEMVFVLKAINDCLIVFFRGQVLVAGCVGLLLMAGYLLMGLHYAVLLGGVAAVLGIVPYMGTIITLILALSVAAVQFGDWTHPLMVLALAVVVKMLEDFVIGPKIIGDRAGLHPLTIIIAVMIGTTVLGGVLGALLAIPLTAALRTLMFRYVWKRPTRTHRSSPEQAAAAS